MFTTMSEFFGVDWCSYSVFAAVSFALAYYFEIVLDIPLWIHECPEVEDKAYKANIQKVVDFVHNLPDMLNLSGYPGRANGEFPHYNLREYEELSARTKINRAISLFRNDKNFETNK